MTATLDLQVPGLKGAMNRLTRWKVELQDLTILSKLLGRLMGETLDDVKARTPTMSAKEESERPEKKIGLREGWALTRPDNRTWMIEHDSSDPSHPHHVILASLEGGSKVHEISASGLGNLTWYDPSLAALLRSKYSSPWVTSDDWIYFGSVTHPGNRPYNMVRDAAEGLRNKIPAMLDAYKREVSGR